MIIDDTEVITIAPEFIAKCYL